MLILFEQINWPQTHPWIYGDCPKNIPIGSCFFAAITWTPSFCRSTFITGGILFPASFEYNYSSRKMLYYVTNGYIISFDILFVEK